MQIRVLHHVYRILALVLGTALTSTPSLAQPALRVSLAELKADLDRQGSPIVLFTSDDPDCGFCTGANASLPARVIARAPGAAVWMVSWSPWRAFPAELGALPLTARLAGIPAVVRFSNGREAWRVTGYSDALVAELDAHLAREAGAPAADMASAGTATPEPRAPGPAARTAGASNPPIASLRLSPAARTAFWGQMLRLDVQALDKAGQPAAVADARWTSSDPSVATVADDGTVTTIRRGTVTISVAAGGHTASTTLAVQGFSRLGRTAAALPCAIADDRIRVFCWGTSRILPTARRSSRTDAPSELMRGDVPADAEIVTLAADAQHACLLTRAGSLHCWGQQKDGAAGTGDLTPRNVPTRVAGGELPASARITDVAVGPNGSCAIADAQALFCWGARGELPAGARLSAVSMSINGGCVIANGAPYCWKRGTRVPGPMRLDAGDLPAGVALEEIQSDDFTCARGQDGRAYCWGNARGHRFGAGHDTFQQQPAPLAVTRGGVPQGIAFSRVTLGGSAGASCGLGTDGKAYCWGNAANGAAGDGEAARHTVLAPAPVLPGDTPSSVKYVDINCGEQFCTALGDDDVLYGWGLNLGDTLAHDTQRMRLATAPVRAQGPAN